MITDIKICKLPYQEHPFVRGIRDGQDVWLQNDGTWTEIDGDPQASIPVGFWEMRHKAGYHISTKELTDADPCHAYIRFLRYDVDGATGRWYCAQMVEFDEGFPSEGCIDGWIENHENDLGPGWEFDWTYFYVKWLAPRKIGDRR